MKSLDVTNEMSNLVGKYFDGEVPFSTQDMEEMNVNDAKDWLKEGQLLALVSEEAGGIIGYIHQDYAEDVATVLSLRVLTLNELSKPSI